MVRDILAAASATEDKLYPEDVFISYLRTGTGADVTVPTNIDMTKGYMVWTKGRSGGTDNAIYDSARGVTKDLVTNSTAAQTTQATGLKAVSTTGHTIGSLAKMNTSGATYVDWVFKKAPKFFDIVTYTGNGVAGRQIPHNLGCEVGMMIVKGTNATNTDWAVYHKSHGNIGGAQLNTITAFFTQSGWWNNTTPTSNSFTVGTNYSVNTLGTTYVAYLYAHDTSADGMIQCGSFTTDVSGNATVTLGWEPQYLMFKRVDGGSGWYINDIMRGAGLSGTTSNLYTNYADSEAISAYGSYPTETGFKTYGNIGTSGNFIYLAIRRPMKVPTSGTEVYNAIGYTGNSIDGRLIDTGFTTDFAMAMPRNTTTSNGFCTSNRLTGGPYLQTASTQVELPDDVFYKTNNYDAFSTQTGVYVGNDSDANINVGVFLTILYGFKRAKGFFDNFCWTGTGVNRAIAHNLGVAPELLILKSRSATGDWQVWFNGLASNEKLLLNSTAAKVTDATLLNSTLPTSALISLGTQAAVNTSSATYVGYAFASLAGVQKIGTYVGNGTTQNLSFGFSAGARFFLCKAVTTTGSYWVFDSVRGIVASTDFGLQLNSTAAETTSADCVDPFVGGISVVEEATCHLNTNGVTYMYWAIA